MAAGRVGLFLTRMHMGSLAPAACILAGDPVGGHWPPGFHTLPGVTEHYTFLCGPPPSALGWKEGVLSL